MPPTEPIQARWRGPAHMANALFVRRGQAVKIPMFEKCDGLPACGELPSW